MTQEQLVRLARLSESITHWTMEAFYSKTDERREFTLGGLQEKIRQFEDFVAENVDTMEEQS